MMKKYYELFSINFWLQKYLTTKGFGIHKHRNFLKANTYSLVFYPTIASEKDREGYRIPATAHLAIKIVELIERGEIDPARMKFESVIKPPITKDNLREIVKGQQIWYNLANCE